MHQETLIIFFKGPVSGQVKTRLANDLGKEKACLVYKNLFAHTKKQSELWAKKTIDRKIVFYGTGDISTWSQLGLTQAKHQYGFDLGLRMENAIREELNFAKKVCIIGTDLPEISIEVLENAFEKLNKTDTVLGSALDGGFYLFGTNKMPVNVFCALPWSKANTLQKTQFRLDGMHLTTGYIQPLRDIDTLNDLKLYPKFYSNVK